MNPMKRLGMPALLAVAVTLLASTLASAGKPPGPAGETWGPVGLTNVGDEPRASGEATLTEVVLVGTVGDPLYDYSYWDCCTGNLTVQCKKLMPGATYETAAGTFTANSRGEIKVSRDVYFEIEHFFGWSWHTVPYVVDVVRLNPDGSRTTVLTGNFRPPFGW